MAFQLEYLDEVLTDIQEAKAWYKKQREGLEEEFAAAILQAIERILLIPSAYRIRYKNIRIAHPQRFPYNIHFYFTKSKATVVITAIVHNKRSTISVRKRRGRSR